MAVEIHYGDYTSSDGRFFNNAEPGIVISGDFGNYMLWNREQANNVLINYYGGRTLVNNGSYVKIYGSDKGDHICSGGATAGHNTIYAGGGDDNVTCDDGGEGTFIDMGDGDDWGRNSVTKYGTLLGGPGNDTLLEQFS